MAENVLNLPITVDEAKEEKKGGGMNLHLDLPEATVKMLDKHGLMIEMEKLVQNVLTDQGSGMVASDGCISNPGGPSC
jgi:hypothetical protein